MPQLDPKAILAALTAQQPANEKDIDELVLRVQEARKSADEAISKLFEVSSELREKVRMAPTAGAHSHMIFANAYIRLAAAFAQGLKRLVSTDRLLVRAKSEQEEAARDEAQQKARDDVRRAKKQADKLVQRSDSAFDELYGDVISNAK